MHLKFLRAFSVRLFIYLFIMLPEVVLCQGQFCKNFTVAETWRNCCPDPEDATSTYYAKSRIKCATECNLSSQWCFGFSYYAASRRCNFYSFVPTKIYYDSDCTFILDWNAYLRANCTAMALAKGSCRGSTDDYYGCLTITITTSTNDTFTVCPVLPGVSMQLEMLSLNLGGNLLPLPIANSWIITMQRFDGTLDFNRLWTDYRNGFGDIGRGEFWLGIEKVRLITAQPGRVYQLQVEVQLKTSGRWFSTDYATFSLDSEINKYAIRVSGFSGSAGDSFTNTSAPSYWYHGGMNFSTQDNDNDRDPANNCAQAYQAGWWYNDCWMSCLTCKYGYKFAWESLKHLESGGLLRAARMLIRSK